jgi:hypothetical protein
VKKIVNPFLHISIVSFRYFSKIFHGFGPTLTPWNNMTIALIYLSYRVVSFNLGLLTFNEFRSLPDENFTRAECKDWGTYVLLLRAQVFMTWWAHSSYTNIIPLESLYAEVVAKSQHANGSNLTISFHVLQLCMQYHSAGYSFAQWQFDPVKKYEKQNFD